METEASPRHRKHKGPPAGGPFRSVFRSPVGLKGYCSQLPKTIEGSNRAAGLTLIRRISVNLEL
jgi:hypothetical protein